MIEAFPLCWPANYPRTPESYKTDARFSTSFGAARDYAIRQLELLKATDFIISSNVPVTKGGIPYANGMGRVGNDTGIAVYFTLNKEQKVIACDAFYKIEENMQAVAKSLEALRGLERWKCSNILQQAFTGFTALPESNTFWQLFGLSAKPATKEDLKKAWHNAAKRAQGDNDKLSALNNAYTTALKTFE